MANENNFMDDVLVYSIYKLKIDSSNSNHTIFIIAKISEKIKEYNGRLGFIFKYPFYDKSHNIILYFAINTERKNISQFEDELKAILPEGSVLYNKGVMDYWSFKDYVEGNKLDKEVENLKKIEEIDLWKYDIEWFV